MIFDIASVLVIVYLLVAPLFDAALANDLRS